MTLRIGLALVLLLAFAPPASALTLTVNSGADLHDVNIGNGECDADTWHVDRDGTDLEDREQGDDVLDGVLGVEPDVIALPDPLAGQVVGQLVGLTLELCVSHFAVADLDRHLLGRGVDGVFEEVSDVVAHGARLEHVLVLG